MKYLNIFFSVALLTIFAACSKEDPFGYSKVGKINTRSLSVELANEENTRATRANVDIDDFTVQFIKNGDETPVESFRYGDMPEVVELPVGTYTARAFLGSNPSAAWEAPFYEGWTLSSFVVKADQVTMVADPIVCSLANVKVSVAFTEELAAVMSADSKVEVKVGEHGSSLDFTVADIDRSGYFAYVEDSHTLAATFIGEVQGFPATETKVYDDVRPGNHYRITFGLHTPGQEPGDIHGVLLVDATVEIEDVNRPIDAEDEILIDDMRPKEEGDDPEPPQKEGPSVVAREPISFDKANDIDGSSTVIIDVKSTAPAGIETCEVHIISEKLSASELQSMGLSDKLDLVNPGDAAEILDGMGFPVNVGGRKDLTFDISGFMSLLVALTNQGETDIHSFKFIIGDANGTTEKTLTLRVKK